MADIKINSPEEDRNTSSAEKGLENKDPEDPPSINSKQNHTLFILKVIISSLLSCIFIDVLFSPNIWSMNILSSGIDIVSFMYWIGNICVKLVFYFMLYIFFFAIARTCCRCIIQLLQGKFFVYLKKEADTLYLFLQGKEKIKKPRNEEITSIHFAVIAIMVLIPILYSIVV
jgi:hypothetical protein